MQHTNLENLKQEARRRFNSRFLYFAGRPYKEGIELTHNNARDLLDELITHAYQTGIKAAMDLVEEEDPSTSRTTSPAYWGNKLRARMNQLLSEK